MYVLHHQQLSKHRSQQLYWWWQREDETLQHHLTSMQLFIGTLVSVQEEGGATAPTWLAVRGREVPTVTAWGKKQATGCAFSRTRTKRDKGDDKAERKSWAHRRRSDKSRRRRSCLSGRCRGRRPWWGGPRREWERWGARTQRGFPFQQVFRFKMSYIEFKPSASLVKYLFYWLLFTLIVLWVLSKF